MSLLSFAKKQLAPRQPASRRAARAPKAVEKDANKPAAQSVAGTNLLSPITIQPLLTEKSTVVHGQHHTVAFRVTDSASKGQVAAAVQARYGIAPVKVRTLQQRGKIRRRGKTSGATARWKKAYVMLPAGASIDVGA